MVKSNETNVVTVPTSSIAAAETADANTVALTAAVPAPAGAARRCVPEVPGEAEAAETAEETEERKPT